MPAIAIDTFPSPMSTMPNMTSLSAELPGGPPPLERMPNGRIRRTDLSTADRLLAVSAHLWWLLLITPLGPLSLAAPLVIWLAFRGRNHFVSDHGQEAVNLIVSLIIMHLLLGITFIGVAFWPILWIYAIVGIVRAVIAANGGEYFRYPATIRLF